MMEYYSEMKKNKVSVLIISWLGLKDLMKEVRSQRSHVVSFHYGTSPEQEMPQVTLVATGGPWAGR